MPIVIQTKHVFKEVAKIHALLIHHVVLMLFVVRLIIKQSACVHQVL